MQNLLSTTIATIAAATTILIGSNLPVISQLTAPAVAQTATAQKPIVLKLSQFKKVADKKGFKLEPVTKAQPGDIIAYNIAASNVSTKAINKLALAKGMVKPLRLVARAPADSALSVLRREIFMVRTFRA